MSAPFPVVMHGRILYEREMNPSKAAIMIVTGKKNLNTVDEEESKLIEAYPLLFQILERLRGITGFVSILGDDPRIQVFQRSHHIDRVVQLTRVLCSQYASVDRITALLIAHAHDVNRLPFAHNLEERINFDQAGNLPTYLHSHGVSMSEDLVSQIQSMIDRDVNGPPAARLAYAADAAIGFIEDPLMAVTTLGMDLSKIPADVSDALGINLDDPQFRGRITELAQMFRTNPASFTGLFNDTVLVLAVDFVRRHSLNGRQFVELPGFQQLRYTLRKRFLETHVFPINNEAVSQGSRLVDEVALPLMEAFRSEGNDPVALLQDMTDQEVVDCAVKRQLIVEPVSFHPLLPSDL